MNRDSVPVDFVKARFDYTRAIFDAIFLALLNATFVAGVNLAAIPMQLVPADVPCFNYFSFSQIITISCMKFQTYWKPLRYRGGKSHRNRCEITLSIFIANSGATKIELKSATKIAPKIRIS